MVPGYVIDSASGVAHLRAAGQARGNPCELPRTGRAGGWYDGSMSYSSFSYRGRQISYSEHGSGPRAIVLVHGLLMDSRMYTKLAPMLAAAGHRVITADMLGHGSSAQPHVMTEYSMPQFGRDVIALLDHLELAQAVIGGTSLGANVALEAAVAAPARIRALVLEMPVLENALPAAAAAFVPLALALRASQRLMAGLSALTRLIPRSHFLIDMAIDFVRRDPAASIAVLDGLLFGRVAPPPEDRRTLGQPALVIGHPKDPIHPFSDADRVAHDLPHARLVTARSMFEWRLRPERLDRELVSFLDDVWGRARAVA